MPSYLMTPGCVTYRSVNEYPPEPSVITSISKGPIISLNAWSSTCASTVASEIELVMVPAIEPVGSSVRLMSFVILPLKLTKTSDVSGI